MLTDDEKIAKCKADFVKNKLRRRGVILSDERYYAIHNVRVIGDNSFMIDTFNFKGNIVAEVSAGAFISEGDFVKRVYDSYDKGSQTRISITRNDFINERRVMDTHPLFSCDTVRENIRKMILDLLDPDENVEEPWVIFRFFGIKIKRNCNYNTFLTFTKHYAEKFLDVTHLQSKSIWLVIDTRTGNRWTMLTSELSKLMY